MVEYSHRGKYFWLSFVLTEFGFAPMFPFNEKSDKSFNMNTRSKKAKLKYHEVLTRTNRYQRSPIPFLTNILNSVDEK